MSRRRPVGGRALALAAAALLALPQIGSPAGASTEQRDAVYVGARVCATCHEGAAAGNQFSRWLLSKHAKAYAALSLPEAKAIARLSGIPGDPKASQNCLGCHATASDEEPWRKDPTFALEDGIQCEFCHGPGSEYMDETVMRDPTAAAAAGLRKITQRDCRLCHYVKGSHVAVHHLPQLDVEEAWKRIAHPTPDGMTPGSRPEPPAPAAARRPAAPGGGVEAASAPAGMAASGAAPARYIGARACGACHDLETQTCRWSRWRMSPHANAYPALSTPGSAAIAAKEGILGDPQRSPSCLRCHATGFADPAGGVAGAYAVDDGVGCESCHGPGSEYGIDAVMRDPRAARAAGLRTVDRDTCLGCHGNAHGKPFDVDAALAKMRPAPKTAAGAGRGPAADGSPRGRPGASAGGAAGAHGGGPSAARTDEMLPAPSEQLPIYKTPLNLAFRPDGREIWVACEASGSVVVVDPAARKKVAEIPVGGQPADVAFSPDGTRAYVSNRLDDTVSVLDVAARRLVRSVPVGDEPHGLLTDRTGRRLFVLNTASDTITILDTETFAEIRTLAAGRGPWSPALTPDGSRLLVTNYLSAFVPFRTESNSEVTSLDVEEMRVANRPRVPGANLMLGAAWHPSGEFALVTLNRTKNNVPLSRLQQGWTITNGLGVVGRDGRVDQVLLDEPGLYFPDATDVAFTPDGSRALVTSAGSDRLAVVDVARLRALIDGATPREREVVLPNHLGMAARFLAGHVPTGASPRGVAVAPDGAEAFVADALDDTLTVVDLGRLVRTGTIDLGGPAALTKERRGERLFNSARITFQRQFSCHSCHPDGHVDGLTYDIEADGIGVNPVDNRTLRGILDTDPFKWTGTNPSLARQCGPRLSVFFTRLAPFTPDELDALDTYICTIPRPPNRYRAVGAPLNEAQRRGKAIFERAVTNDGRVIPADNRCVTCHNPPLYTDRSKRRVGPRLALDQHAEFDVPHLNNIYDSAPYLHNGVAPTLEEIWTRYNPQDEHGVTNDLTKDQLNDLIEYLRTL